MKARHTSYPHLAYARTETRTPYPQHSHANRAGHAHLILDIVAELCPRATIRLGAQCISTAPCPLVLLHVHGISTAMSTSTAPHTRHQYCKPVALHWTRHSTCQR
eukprot:965858-Rhodomonas_salina.1